MLLSTALVRASIFLLVLVRARGSNDFSGQQVVTVVPQGQRDLETLRSLRDDDFDFWTSLKLEGNPVDIRVTSDQKSELASIFGADNLSVRIPDLGSLIESFAWATPKPKGYRWLPNEYHESYHEWEEIVDFIEQLESDYAGLVTLSSMGESWEGRDMILACVSTDQCRSGKPSFFVNDAREWISHATVLYMFEALLLEHTTNSSDLLERMDFWIAPQVNPDGYAFTGQSNANRMWRKTRKPNPGYPNCPGTDPNRNFEFEWGGPGTSSDPCSDTYKGEAPADNPEIAAVTAAVLARPEILVYFDTHSYGNYFLSSWGFTKQPPPDIDDLNDAAKFATDAIRAVNGTRYTYGPSSTTLYPVSGGAKDTFYCAGLGSAKYSYTCELPGLSYGFALPPEYILPVARETWEGYKAMAEFALTKPECAAT